MFHSYRIKKVNFLTTKKVTILLLSSVIPLTSVGFPFIWMQISSDTVLDKALGPLGALVVVIAVAFFLYKYLMKREKKHDEETAEKDEEITALRNEMIEAAKEEAEFWKNKAEALEEELKKGKD